MIAVIKTGGKQYVVKEGDVITVEKLPGVQGDSIDFSEVLFYSDDEAVDVILGNPTVAFTVRGIILESGKGKKITVIKYKPKVRYRRKKGHRQQYTKVKIDTITKK